MRNSKFKRNSIFRFSLHEYFNINRAQKATARYHQSDPIRPMPDVLNMNDPEMQHMLEFKYPCGLTGHEIDQKPINHCDMCDIDTSLCVDYYANARMIYLNHGKLSKKKGKVMMSFEQYIEQRENGLKSQEGRK
jgi:hypothetical protein